MYVLDTNIVAAALNGHGPTIRRLRTLAPTDVTIPVVVLGELIYGAIRSSRRQSNLDRVHRICATFHVAPVDVTLMERYAALRADLDSRGRRKGDFDLLIACCALCAGGILVTNDAALKAGDIADLRVEDWLDA